VCNGTTSLLALFDSIEPPRVDRAEPHFMARPLPGRKSDFLGKSVNGQPALLINSTAATTGAPPPPINLEHLIVDHGLECQVQQLTGPVLRGVFSVLQCVDADRLLQEYFLRSVVPIIHGLPVAPSYADIARAVNALAELFQRMASPAKKPIQGLWAELCVIAVSKSPRILIKAWHSTPSDRYDFSSGSERIEVKSASGSERIHHFSFEQLQPAEGIRLLVASMFVNEADDGLNAFDLVDKIRHRLSGEIQRIGRVDQVVGSTLGSSWRQASEMRFDFEEATASLRYYEPSVIPSIQGPLPAGVSHVRYQSDLSAATPSTLPPQSSDSDLLLALGG
jgi:hypothetical protein